MLGRYTNKHNGRMIVIDRVEIGDTGASFWYAGDYDCFTTRELEKHWVMEDDEIQAYEDNEHEISLERVGDAVRDVCEYLLERQETDGLTTEQGDLINRLHKFLAIELGVDEE